ncbi:MAG: ubiquitin-like small modifier protein 1 [Candidatus Limnocylindria bacterium]
MSKVRIPPVLRDVVGGSRELSASGATVAEVLDDLFASQPALADRLTAGSGTLSAFVNVFVNGDDVRHRQGLETRVGADDVVILLPAMAGGASNRRPEGPDEPGCARSVGSVA